MAMLDHLIVPSHDRKSAAKFLAKLLNVPAGDSFGVFSAVCVNDSLTIHFMQGDEFDVHHYCFSQRVQSFKYRAQTDVAAAGSRGGQRVVQWNVEEYCANEGAK